MNRFAIITALTPTDLMTPLRKRLRAGFFQALAAQTSQDWTALLVGEKDREDGNLRFLRCASRDTMSRRLLAAEYVSSANCKPEFVIRLDDDDLISPTILEHAANIGFDCLADRYHSFFEISSQMFCQAKKNWLANTVIHRTEHALSTIKETDQPLIASDHSRHWLPYYQTKRLRYLRRDRPIYLRVLSPTSISVTSRGAAVGSDDVGEYQKYVMSRGRWKRKPVAGFAEWTGWADNLTDDFDLAGLYPRGITPSPWRSASTFGPRLNEDMSAILERGRRALIRGSSVATSILLQRMSR